MRRITPVLLLVLFLLAHALAQEPWRVKDFKVWNAEEVRRVLDDSPWAKVVAVDITWRTTQGKAGETARPASDMRLDTLRRVPQAPFLVRWASARTVRMALARHAMLTRGSSGEEADRFVARVPEWHEFIVSGPDITPLKSAGPEPLKSSALLVLKSSGRRVPAAVVEIMQRKENEKLEAVAFRFPRNAPDGAVYISSKEKSIEFVCKISGAEIKASFELAKMISRAGPDF
jgi:hypothetical protein